jgi:hypothetical protein
MKKLEIKNRKNEIEIVFLEKRIDFNFFSCKSSPRKRKADLLVHIDYILNDVSNITFENPKYENSNDQIPMSRDEFDGLCQSNEIGENPFKCSIMCSNPKLNEVG